jgi:hypothetical protein
VFVDFKSHNNIPKAFTVSGLAQNLILSNIQLVIIGLYSHYVRLQSSAHFSDDKYFIKIIPCFEYVTLFWPWREVFSFSSRFCAYNLILLVCKWKYFRKSYSKSYIERLGDYSNTSKLNWTAQSNTFILVYTFFFILYVAHFF